MSGILETAGAMLIGAALGVLALSAIVIVAVIVHDPDRR